MEARVWEIVRQPDHLQGRENQSSPNRGALTHSLTAFPFFESTLFEVRGSEKSNLEGQGDDQTVRNEIIKIEKESLLNEQGALTRLPSSFPKSTLLRGKRVRNRKTYRQRDDQNAMFVLNEMIKLGNLLLTEQGVLTHSLPFAPPNQLF